MDTCIAVHIYLAHRLYIHRRSRIARVDQHFCRLVVAALSRQAERRLIVLSESTHEHLSARIHENLGISTMTVGNCSLNVRMRVQIEYLLPILLSSLFMCA